MTAASPLTRYGAHWGARFASGYATALQLHHVRGHDQGHGRTAVRRLDPPGL